MKVAIHQPNYLPWIGFFDKLDQVDKFVLLDTALHSKSSFMQRNKIKTPQGALWLTVPLKEKEIPLNQINIDNSQHWRERHWRAIESNYKKSKYWLEFKDGFEQIYSRIWTKLVELNLTLITHITTLLNYQTEILLESDYQVDFGRGNQRNINIVK